MRNQISMPFVALAALLVLSTGCGGGGGGSAAPPDGEEPEFTLEFLSVPDSLLAGEPMSVTHRVSGSTSGTIEETSVLWATSPQTASIGAYPERGDTWRFTALPGEFTGGMTAPFAGGVMYLRVYARIQAEGTTDNYLSDEISIPVLDLPWTGPAAEEVSYLTETVGFDRLGGFGHRTSDDYLHSLVGATYLAPSGQSMTIWYGEDGLPVRAATTTGLVFEFDGWTNLTVDVRMSTLAGGLVHSRAGVPVSEARITRLLGLAAEDYIGRPAPPEPAELRLEGDTLLVLGSDRAAKLLKSMGLGIRVLGEIAAGLEAGAEWDDELAPVLAAAADGVVPAAAELRGDESIPAINTALDSFTCFDVDVCLSQARGLLNGALAANATLMRAVLGN